MVVNPSVPYDCFELQAPGAHRKGITNILYISYPPLWKEMKWWCFRPLAANRQLRRYLEPDNAHFEQEVKERFHDVVDKLLFYGMANNVH